MQFLPSDGADGSDDDIDEMGMDGGLGHLGDDVILLDGDDEQEDRPGGREDGDERTQRRKSQRREANRRYKSRILDDARQAAENEALAASLWTPARVVEIVPEVGLEMAFRWRCEKFCRAYNAWVGAIHGVNIHKTLVQMDVDCRRKTCGHCLRFARQGGTGMWRLVKFKEHSQSCFSGSDDSNDNTSGRSVCVAAYTAPQIARLLLCDGAGYFDSTLTAKCISDLVRAKELYSRHPPLRHFRAVKKVMEDMLLQNRAEDMAGMRGYMSLLRDEGHTVELYTMTGTEMKQIRVKAAEFIFKQMKKGGTVRSNERFDSSIVSTDDISDEGVYYGGFLFIPSIAPEILKNCRMTAAADASHCQGIGPQSYGTIFEVVVYDANNHVIPVLFYHSVGTECDEAWGRVFGMLKKVDGFDVPGRVTIVDQEKSIDCAYRREMEHASLFLDALHVKKNMSPLLGSNRAAGVSLYERALYAPSKAEVDSIKEQYGLKQSTYLSRFRDSELYRAYSPLQDLITTSQGAESQMSASLRNRIRSVEPQQMLEAVVAVQRSCFLRKKRNASQCTVAVPPKIEAHLAMLIGKSRRYQKSVRFIDGTDFMEATVLSHTDATKRCHVKLQSEKHTPPLCCAYSLNCSGFPCYHAVAVLCEKHGAVNLHKFISERHLTTTWKRQYNGFSFDVPHQSAVDLVRLDARRLVAQNSNVRIPVALAPPRGRPVKNAGTRKRSWFEKGPHPKNKRPYSCSLCHGKGHTAKTCSLRQGPDSA